MKFESKFGINEIVATKIPARNIHSKGGRTYHDELFKIVGVYFSIDNKMEYGCRHSDGWVIAMNEAELESCDKTFDQEKGCYPSEDDDQEKI